MKRLYFRDPHTMALQYSIETPQCAGINHADLSIDGRFVIFTCEYQGSLTKIDVVDRKVLGYLTLSRGGMPQDIYASRDGTKLYIANRGSSVPPAHRTASRSTHRDSENRFERARGQCEDCGLHVGRSGWIRHKTSPGMTCDEYNDLDNLALLCPPCHRRAPHARRGVATRLPIVAPSQTSTIRLGERILRRRQEQHLTRKQLAARAHTSRAYLAKIERGVRLASRALLARIARALRCSATEFVAD